MTRRLITKEELAEILGLIREDGTPMTEGISVKAASGEWPSRLVLGKLRFSDPEDVEAILEICKRGGDTTTTPSPVPEPRRRKRRQTTSTAGAFGDLSPLPIRDRRQRA
jgi:hypothetical protein